MNQETFYRFFLAKFVQSLIVLWLLVTCTFFLLRLLPGGPFDSEMALAPEVKQNLERQYGLAEPILIQYMRYLKNLSGGDLGVSYRYLDQKVNGILSEALPPTLVLGAASFVLSCLIGFSLGMCSVAFHNKKTDQLIQFISISFISLPTFVLAPCLVLIFSLWLDWLPPALWDGPRYAVLPVLALSMRPAAMITRLVRAQGLEVVHMDFIKAAHAKGVSSFQIYFKHVLKNSLVPFLGLAGTLLANILSGSFVIELIFAIPGVARHFIESVSNRDYTMVLGLTLFYGFTLIAANFFFDTIAGFIDPRLQSSAGQE